MSTVFSKNKGKRSRSSSSEANTSFVKNVTSRVTGLLPSTITKWFSSPSSSNANGSTQTADATDSSTEDEAPDSPVTQPPAKRKRFSPSSYNNFGPTDVNYTTSSGEVPEVQPYSPFSGTQFTPTRGPVATTPLRTPEEANKDNNDKDTPPVYKTQSQLTVAGIGQSIANKRKSIFETSTKKEDSVKACAKSSLNTSSDIKKPRFKPSLLGSPFYPGRTMYGGASSSYINEPDIREQKVALVNESKNTEDSMLSSSARRIMDLLESYSSPLQEARRIPQYTRPMNDSMNLSSRYDPYASKSISNRTQELHVPSIASILRLKKKSRLMDTTNAARQLIASHSSASYYPSYPLHNPQIGKGKEAEQTTKMTTKVKTKVTRTNRAHDELEVLTPVKLPDTILNIDQNNLPKFSLNTPAKSKLPTTSTPKLPVYNKKSSEIIVNKPETKPSSMFKFSNPVKISCDTPEPVTTSSKFSFESPERQIDNVETKTDFPSSKPVESEKPAAKDWQCGDCWVKNKDTADKCLCCGGKKPSAAPKCSACKKADCQPQKDKCTACLNIGISHVASTLPKTPASDSSASWKCGDCWVNNTNTDKCVCCGSKRPQSNTAPAPAAAPVAVASNADWKCGDCWVTNKPHDTKCVACGGQKPGTQSAPQKLPAFSKLQDKDIKQNNISKAVWECSGCLVKNDIEKKVCDCCGTSSKKVDSAPLEKFSFGKKIPSFKFGIDQAEQEAALQKKTEVTPAVVEKPKENSETNNNVLNETPTFTFGIPSKKIDTKIDLPKDPTPPTFTFAMPKQSSSLQVTVKPQEPTKSVDDEKPQEVPSVNFKTATDKISQPTTNLFTSPITLKSTQEISTPSVSTSLNLLVGTSKDTLTKPVSSAPVVTSAEQSQPANKFTFGTKTNLFTAPATTSSSNMFPMTPAATPATETKTSSLFTPPQDTGTQITAALSAPATTSAPALSLFKPPESGTTALFTLVRKSEPSATSTPAAPVFSFGNKATTAPAPAPAAAPAPDKPKFQFTFGSNMTPKTEAPALFKSPFGSGTETNTFSLGSSSTLGTGGVNALGGSNGPVANGLAMGGLTSNTLPGNSMSSNSLGNMLSSNPLTGVNNVAPSNPLGGTNGLPTNPLSPGNGLQANNTLGTSPGLFGNTTMNENVWSANSTPVTNLFVSNTSTNSLQKPAAFTFASATPFNATTSTPAFGNNPTPASNMFGLGNQSNNSQPPMFSNPVQSQPQANIFGSPPAPSNPNQPVLFGASNVSAVPTFGAPNTSIPSFEAPSLAPAPAPAFNFGAPQATGIFGFGQQASPAGGGGVYSFGGGSAAAPQVQFNMGTGANNPAMRRMRKAVRRNPQR